MPTIVDYKCRQMRIPEPLVAEVKKMMRDFRYSNKKQRHAEKKEALRLEKIRKATQQKLELEEKISNLKGDDSSELTR